MGVYFEEDEIKLKSITPKIELYLEPTTKKILVEHSGLMTTKYYFMQNK